MIIEVSVAVVAVAFIVLVIYLILMLNALRVTLGQVDQTVVEVRKQLDEIGGQAQKAVEHANQVSFDLKRKMESLNSIFNSFSNIGEILEHKTFALKKEALVSSHKENKLSDIDEQELRVREEINVTDILELVGIGIRLWQKLKNKYSPMAKTKE
jgi:uncharacterized protein YoxC